MQRRNIVQPFLIIFILCLALVGCGAPSSSSNKQPPVAVFDHYGARIEVQPPVEAVISVNSGMTALVYALGAGDRLIGRDAFSTFPTGATQTIDVVAESSARYNLELIISKAPDIVLADPQFDPEPREKLDMAGIPSYVESTSDPERVVALIESVGMLLDANERAGELVQFVTSYTHLVDQRISQLVLEGGDRPRVYFEWYYAFKTANANTIFHQPIVQAGGINIAAGQPVNTPEMSSEWIIRQNPDVIVCRISGDASLEEMKQKYEEIIQRPGWNNIGAVKNGQVYVIKSDVFLTFRYPVGLLYYAIWFHPELFADIDPEAVHQEVITAFFGAEEWETLSQHETFVYPDS